MGTGNELLFPRVSESNFITFSCNFCLPRWLLNCLKGSVVVFFEESVELLHFFYKQTWLMARYNARDVLDRVWKDSGSKGLVIVTTLVGILIQIVKVKNGVVILLKLQKAAIPKVAMSQRKVTTSLLQKKPLIHGGKEGSHIKLSFTVDSC